MHPEILPDLTQVYYHNSALLEFDLGNFSSVIPFQKVKTLHLNEFYYKIKHFGISEIYPVGNITRSGFENVVGKLITPLETLEVSKTSVGYPGEEGNSFSPIHTPNMPIELYVKHLVATDHICRVYIHFELYKPDPIPFPEEFEFSEVVEYDFFTSSGIHHKKIPLRNDYAPYLRSLYLYGDLYDSKFKVTVSADIMGSKIDENPLISNLRLLSERKHHFKPIPINSTNLDLIINDGGSGGADVKVIAEIAYANRRQI